MTRKPSKDFSNRWHTARLWQLKIEPYVRAVYEFCAPDRANEFDETEIPDIIDTQVYTGLGEEAAGDLAGDLVTYFTPPEANWFETLVTTEIPQDFAKEVKAIVSAREDDVRDLFLSSNYYDTAPQWAFEAATHGTPAIWVQQAHIQQPIHFEVVPPHELFICPGHLGILDRFRRQRLPAREIKPSLAVQIANGEVSFEEPHFEGLFRDDNNQMAWLTWGFWLDWSDPAFPQWKMEITVDDIRVTPDEPINLGPMNGACPLIAGRFNPRPKRPWGRGPGLKALADLRVLDAVEESVLMSLEDALKNTLIYPDEGFLDFSEGIVPGTAYPAARTFTRDQIYELNKTGNLEVGFFSEENLERRIRTAFYQDGPRQRGDTPPTATQWLDEARRVQQKLGKPSAPLWTEFVFPMIQRVEYLGAQSGEIDAAVMFDGKEISVQPISPLQKAQNRDQVLISRSNVELAANLVGPEAVGQVVDMRQTFNNIVDASGDTLTVISEEEPPSAPTET